MTPRITGGELAASDSTH